MQQESSRDQTSHAMPDQEQRPLRVRLADLLQQRGDTVKVHAEAFDIARVTVRLSMSVVIERVRGKSALRQVVGDVHVAATVFAESMHK